MEQKKAIIMGASSGMGKELAKILSGHDYIRSGKTFCVLINFQDENLFTWTQNVLSGTVDSRKTGYCTRRKIKCREI